MFHICHIVSISAKWVWFIIPHLQKIKLSLRGLSILRPRAVIRVLASYILGEGNGNSLQYSHQESPMDRGAWSIIQLYNDIFLNSSETVTKKPAILKNHNKWQSFLYLIINSL